MIVIVTIIIVLLCVIGYELFKFEADFTIKQNNLSNQIEDIRQQLEELTDIINIIEERGRKRPFKENIL